MKYLVVSCEHTESCCEMPMLLGSFNTRKDAEEFREKMIMKSLAEFEDEEEVETGLVQSFNDDDSPKYGYAIAILEFKDDDSPSVCETDDDCDGRERNKYDVPYHCYRIVFYDGTDMSVDVGDEDDWGNLQHCNPYDECCKDDWENAIGYGNDCDGHKKIIRVIDMEDGSEWIGNNAISSWYADCVANYVDNYSS